jgi:uncharacterized protein
VTPWGTVLTAEENFNQYFANAGTVTDPVAAAGHTRIGMPGEESERSWETYHPRFDMAQPAGANEPHRFGYIVEIDPYDPAFVPRKRTALGRCKHEACQPLVGAGDRVAFYSGDDERFEYVYKFVCNQPWNRTTRAANFGMLDDGTLYVAQFAADGTGTWIALTPSSIASINPGAAASFPDQATICVQTRAAADAVAATPMDRPEDIDVNPINNKIYVMLTNNTNRGNGRVGGWAGRPELTSPEPDAANPRARNANGHVVEITETGDDPTATTFTWTILLFGGAGPTGSTVPAERNLGAPDNCTFDSEGNIWISTDGAWRSTARWNDAVWVAAVDGPERGVPKQFASAPTASEICGPTFTPDETTLFINIQHPGEAGQSGRSNEPGGPGSLARPLSTWNPGGGAPTRPALVAITRIDGGKVGI